MEKYKSGQPVGPLTKEELGLVIGERVQDYHDEKAKEKLDIMQDLGMNRAVYNKTAKYEKVTNVEVERRLQRHFKKEIRMDSANLTEWTTDIPMGVLYKIKEAQDLGFEDFRICYPTPVGSKRKMRDPIIIGFKKRHYKRCCCSSFTKFFTIGDCCDAVLNEMVGMGKGTQWDDRQKYLIAEWDDGKIYG